MGQDPDDKPADQADDEQQDDAMSAAPSDYPEIGVVNVAEGASPPGDM